MPATRQRLKARVKNLATLAAADPERFHSAYTKCLVSWREDLRRQMFEVKGAPDYNVIGRALDTLAECGVAAWDAYHGLTVDVLRADWERLVAAIGGPAAKLVSPFYEKTDKLNHRLITQYHRFVQRVRSEFGDQFLRRLRELVFDRGFSMQAAVALTEMETTLDGAGEATPIRKPVGSDVVTQLTRRFRR